MKSGLAFLLIGILCILVAIVGIPAFFVWQLFSGGIDEGSQFTGAEEQFLAPGEVSVEWEAPGEYMVWYNYRATYEGNEYDFPSSLPEGLTVEATDAETGEEASWEPFGDGMDFTLELNDEARKGIGLLGIDKPGTYSVRVSGDFEPRVFAVGTSVFGEVFKGIGPLFIAALLVGICGAAFLIIGIVMMVRGRSEKLKS